MSLANEPNSYLLTLVEYFYKTRKRCLKMVTAALGRNKEHFYRDGTIVIKRPLPVLRD
ncbi:hypothetical protein L2737_10170 [Shewanella electrodiphila]|uniref:Uncharacterized protein n=1 Tax=Shewanella electrodiphila TaxID=934143 RepID=A0ABT0KPX4_9GAMM|nr:hypothetical protein [Shewanella electrodiphila]MCL1045689.1 hypothetical protein [Shewanella electrodiphila]